MKSKQELYDQGDMYYVQAVDELFFAAEDVCLFSKLGFSYDPDTLDIENVVDNGSRVKISFKTKVEGFTEDIILEASYTPFDLENISYVIKCGSFQSKVEIPVADLSKLEEYVARCVYVYEEKSKQYKELCQKALEALSKPTKSISKYLEETVPLVQAVYTEPGITIEEMSNIHHTLGQFEE